MMAYIYIYTYIYILRERYIYIYREREREREVIRSVSTPNMLTLINSKGLKVFYQKYDYIYIYIYIVQSVSRNVNESAIKKLNSKGLFQKECMFVMRDQIIVICDWSKYFILSFKKTAYKNILVVS